LYSLKDAPKPPEFVAPGKTLKKFIMPMVKMKKEGQSWRHLPLNAGVNGVLLAVKVGKQEVTEKITLTLTKN